MSSAAVETTSAPNPADAAVVGAGGSGRNARAISSRTAPSPALNLKNLTPAAFATGSSETTMPTAEMREEQEENRGHVPAISGAGGG